MAYPRGEESSYQRALQSTFNTTYGISYRNVDTVHKSPVYRDGRAYYSNPHILNVPHERELLDGENKKGFYDYGFDPDTGYRMAQTERLGYHDQHRLGHHDQHNIDHEEIFRRPIEKKSCHACMEPEAYAPKNTNQLRCNHKYCDDCILKLHTTNERFGDASAKFFHCDICPSSKTPGPTVIRFDPYGRRVVRIPDYMKLKDSVQRRYNDILANPEEMNEKHKDKPFCHGCFNSNECVNHLWCHHRYCDVCFKKLHCTDNPFRYTTCLHYFCNLCNSKTPEVKVIRFDPYGRRLLQFRDVRYYH